MKGDKRSTITKAIKLWHMGGSMVLTLYTMMISCDTMEKFITHRPPQHFKERGVMCYIIMRHTKQQEGVKTQ